ncbi:MAG TPA: T9SS type A sorting domain-containing protein [Ignavibacteriaceae bacterium]|nr:T9SS type A sorting domain-containing protein [Ignavibacteriaceae bacterium]
MRYLIILFSFVFLNTIYSQTMTKIFSPDNKQDDRFGREISINEKHIVISAPYHNTLTGAVYVYSISDGGYFYLQKLVPDTLINRLYFGAKVLLSDSLLFISSEGYLFIYKKSDSLFKFIKKIFGTALDDFSKPIAEYKKDLLIGAPKSGDLDQGAVYCYNYNSDSTWVLSQMLEPSIFEKYSQFGSTIDFDSSFAVISAPSYGYYSGHLRGMVFLYQKTDSGWIEKQRIYSPDSAYNQLFGIDLKLDKRRIAIGAAGNSQEYLFTGKVYIYAINNSGYAVLEDSIYASDSFEGNGFGLRFELNGDSLFIGASGNERFKNSSFNNKWAYLYVRSKLGWEEKFKIGPTNQNAYNGFGLQVDFNNGNFLVGSPWDSDKKPFGGAVYLFQPNITSIKDEMKVYNFILAQNYPNPFNPTTTISYSLHKKSFTTLKVFDILGREVITLVNEEKPAGSYSVDFNASNLSSGVYFYSLTSGSFTMNKKMILMK